ncbi:metal-dependent transcriptional regulator [bacterium]|nr:metal-dependent transcriptional regulator [bacterium]
MEDVWKQFEENKITHSAAHHLIAVKELRETRGYARVTDVARFLNITTGSASTNLKNLKSKGFILEDDNRFLELSKEGAQLADAVLTRKELLYNFLADVLKVGEEQAEIDACKTEHLISAETASKLEKFLKTQSKKAK